ncbi:hypothetical protein Fleli_3906 [Bernardetia litoralis DSM 6794]|uniref:KWG repeat protein n=1 Tax=Bernardetia litoralis (strain ATCC 23117 / DSM 6794 / NBRC 15988 / NCIMB 1366 / Fx l1 / Sio-4) TaxID=880071 RepID=I4AQH4_BERLS|nr:hypothetical protein [Bernardetia litoralis]AFM06209.1 hypothetical protein Fleli_3906 [Bernardetia litoralis DSM 6794]
MKKILLLFLFCNFSTLIFAQNDSLIFQKSIYFSEKIILSDIDSYGRIYICDNKGLIKRLDSVGNVELTFSPSSSIVPTIFNVQNPNQIFVFYQELQEWVILNRFLTEIERYKISEKLESNNYGEIGFVRLLVPSPNNTLWFFDESDFSLKNYDILNKQILSQTPLGLILKDEEYPISHLQFYQGQVFLGVKGQGILIFDNFGNYKTVLEYPDWNSISFEKEFILITNNQKIIKKGLYDKNLEEIILPKQNTDTTQAINYFFQSNSKGYQITENKIFIYKFSTN